MAKNQTNVLKADKAFGSFSVGDLAQAKKFYGETLGLEVTKEEMGVLKLKLSDATGVMIYPKEKHEAATFTVLNFPVEDIEKAVDELTGRGVKFEQYPDLKTDEKGICRAHGHSIAWFKDPAGNVLSVVEDKE